MADLWQLFHAVVFCFLHLCCLTLHPTGVILHVFQAILLFWMVGSFAKLSIRSQSIFYGISEFMNEVALVLSFKGVLFIDSLGQRLKKHLFFRQCKHGSMPPLFFLFSLQWQVVLIMIFPPPSPADHCFGNTATSSMVVFYFTVS